MKTAEAKKIVGAIVMNNFILMGIKEPGDRVKDIDLRKYTLADLIKANDLVKRSNDRKLNIQKKRQLEGKSIAISQQMVLADRLIASTYTALHFPANGDIHTYVDGIGVGNVVVKED